MNQTVSTDEEKPIAVCFRCGTPLKKSEIILSHKGRWIKWNERQEGEMTTHFCNVCTIAIETIIKEGIRGAMKRKEESEKYRSENESKYL